MRRRKRTHARRNPLPAAAPFVFKGEHHAVWWEGRGMAAVDAAIGLGARVPMALYLAIQNAVEAIGDPKYPSVSVNADWWGPMTDEPKVKYTIYVADPWTGVPAKIGRALLDAGLRASTNDEDAAKTKPSAAYVHYGEI